MDAEGLANNAGVFRVETGEGASEEVCTTVTTALWRYRLVEYVELTSASALSPVSRVADSFIAPRPFSSYSRRSFSFSGGSNRMQFDVACLNAELLCLWAALRCHGSAPASAILRSYAIASLFQSSSCPACVNLSSFPE